jgi:hypothetical protein
LPPISTKLANIDINEKQSDCSRELARVHIPAKTKQLLKKAIEIPPEPSPDDKDSILIGVMLPNGQKFHRHFLLSDSVQKIIDFISLNANGDLKVENCKLLERPKKIIDNFKLTIEQYQLHNRTMLIVITDDDLD